MEKYLTKEEIDALVAAVFDGTLVPEKELSRQAEQFDLLDIEAHRVVPNLDIVYDSFIRYNRVTMSNRLGRLVEIKKEEARPCTFGDFCEVLPSPVCMAIYKLDPLKGAALITLDSTLLFTIVDCILGGSGGGSSNNNAAGNRIFTSIELRLAEKIVRDALADLEKAWAPLCPVEINLLRMEVNPRLVNIVPPEYQVVSMTLKIQIEETVGTMTLAIPFMTIEPIRDKLKRGAQSDMMAVDPLWSYRLSEELLEAPLDISVEMGNATIALSELLNLASGDTIMLESYGKNELAVKVGGVLKLMGVAGVSGGNKAVQISRVLGGGGD